MEAPELQGSPAHLSRLSKKVLDMHSSVRVYHSPAEYRCSCPWNISLVAHKGDCLSRVNNRPVPVVSNKSSLVWLCPDYSRQSVLDNLLLEKPMAPEPTIHFFKQEWGEARLAPKGKPLHLKQPKPNKPKPPSKKTRKKRSVFGAIETTKKNPQLQTNTQAPRRVSSENHRYATGVEPPNATLGNSSIVFEKPQK